MKFFRQKGFTLAELLISLGISVIVLIFVFGFVTDTITTLSDAGEKSKVLNQFYEFAAKFKNYKNTLTNGSVIIDSGSGSGFDVVMFRNYNNSLGIIVGVVDLNTKKLVGNTDYPNYGNRAVGFRELTYSNINDILATPAIAYTYDFYEDKIYSDVITKDFQAEYYNLTILDLNMSILLRYNIALVGTSWATLLKDEVFDVNLDF